MPRTFKSSVLLRRIKKLEDAAVKLSWKGNYSPDYHDEIERNYYKARLALIDYVLEHTLSQE